MKSEWMARVSRALTKAGKKGLGFKELAEACKAKKRERPELHRLLASLEHEGTVVVLRDRYIFTKSLGMYVAKVGRLQRTFGFVRRESDDQEVFVPGRYFKGALVGDTVLVKPIRSQRELPEGEIVAVLECGPSRFTGVIVENDGRVEIMPDSFAKFPIKLQHPAAYTYAVGDKVLAEIIYRGPSHREHKAAVISIFGDSADPAICAEAILESNHIYRDFPQEVLDEARFLQNKGIAEGELSGRLDLRGELIFTIDSAESKDLDDAVSLERDKDGYRLGVHIADVSHYVRYNAPLDAEAFERGTSVYYADQVVPMLPKELSNGICSLNPDEDRLTFSALMQLDQNGRLVDYHIRKSVIRSRVKGVYKEINSILDGSANDAVMQKYAGLRETIFLMKELADKLYQNRLDRGAPELTTTESKFIMQDGQVKDIVPRVQGASEQLIEEFMLLANQSVATLARKNDLPFVYRVHEYPTAEKIDALRETVSLLGLDTHRLKGGADPHELSDLLRQAEGTPTYSIVNRQVLRSMAKAKYSEFPIGHYGLVLKDYAHFTSPIRRYPDLTIHRILTDFLTIDKKKLHRRYEKFAPKAAAQSTACEINAVNTERSCEDCYKAAFMSKHVGEIFDGIISGAAGHGIYVELPNTVEGLVRTEAFPAGDFVFDGLMEFKDQLSPARFRVGDPIRVKCVKTDVNLGQIDFVLAD